MRYNFPKLALFFALSLMASSSFIFFTLYSFVDKKILNSDQVFSDWKVEYNKREEVKLLNNFVKSTSSERASLDTHFAHLSNVVPFLDMFEETGSQLGSKVEIVSVSVSEDNKSLGLEAKISGSFESIYKFIKLLENSPYEIEIASFDISKNSNTISNVKKIAPWSAYLKLKLLTFVK